MSIRKNVIIATSVAALVGSVTIAGISFADRREHGWGHEDHERHSRRFDMGKHRGRHGRQPRGERLLNNFDSNDDGKLTQAEVDQVRHDRFATFDTDKDSKLTLQEYEALWLDAMRSRMVDRFQALDDDGNAAVTPEEFVVPFGKVVNRLDRNDDGELTRDELRRR